MTIVLDLFEKPNFIVCLLTYSTS